MSPATLNSRFFSIFLLVLFLPSAALAQYGASLQGTVTDKTGAVIPGANVTITDQATGVTHSAVTGPEGFYRITGLPPGTYTVDVEASSFKKSSTPGVQVASETATAANVTGWVQYGDFPSKKMGEGAGFAHALKASEKFSASLWALCEAAA